MRLMLLNVAFPFLLAGCSTLAQPEVKLTIQSGKILDVKNFEYKPATEYGSCELTGTIEFDIAVEPKNFTGVVLLQDIKIRYAGTWTRTENGGISFVNGKQYGGMSISEYPLSEDSQNKKDAICKSKSSSDVKLVSLGEGLFATQGIKATVWTGK